MLAFDSVMLTVVFPSFDPLAPEPLPFFAWQAKRWPGPSESPPVRFLVPVSEQGGVELLLEVFGGSGAEARRPVVRSLSGGPAQRAPVAPAPELTTLYTSLTVDGGGRPKLQRGFYFLGLAPGAWRSSWSLPDEQQAREQPPWERCSVVVSVDAVSDDDPRLAAAR
jgi:hypothetical protein